MFCLVCIIYPTCTLSWDNQTPLGCRMHAHAHTQVIGIMSCTVEPSLTYFWHIQTHQMTSLMSFSVSSSVKTRSLPLLLFLKGVLAQYGRQPMTSIRDAICSTQRFYLHFPIWLLLQDQFTRNVLHCYTDHGPTP